MDASAEIPPLLLEARLQGAIDCRSAEQRAFAVCRSSAGRGSDHPTGAQPAPEIVFWFLSELTLCTPM